MGNLSAASLGSRVHEGRQYEVAHGQLGLRADPIELSGEGGLKVRIARFGVQR
jgi:hypothetical protein